MTLCNVSSFIKKSCIHLQKKVSHLVDPGIKNSEYFYRQGNNWKTHPELPQIVAWAIAPWKIPIISSFLPEYRVVIANGTRQWYRKKKILDQCEKLFFLVWGYQEPPEVTAYAAERGIPLYRLEDGFIRSSALGAQHTMPYSLVLDTTGLYFDATRPSDLENLLNAYPFQQYPALLRAARQLLSVMRVLHVSKYNLGSYGVPCPPPLEPRRRRVLVIGQVSKDASLRYGLAADWSDEKLLEKAREDNPEAEILYRPHPETLYLARKEGRLPLALEGERLCTMVPEGVILAELFEHVDHVYTMTSLCGMEALIHGLPVTTAGMPFYAGWGLTYDLQSCERRMRRLSLEELFCGAYILYPRYYGHCGDPISGCINTIAKVVSPRFKGIVSRNYTL